MIARKHRTALVYTAFALTLLLTACSKLPKSPLKTAAAKPEPTQPSAIKVDVKTGGPVVLTTSAAEFQVTPDGYVQASLLPDGKKRRTEASLDEPNVGAPADSDFVRVGGKDVHFNARLSNRRRSTKRLGRWELGSGWRFRRVRSGHRERICSAYWRSKFMTSSRHSAKHGGIQEHRSERSCNREERESAAPVERAAWRREGAAMEMWSFHARAMTGEKMMS